MSCCLNPDCQNPHNLCGEKFCRSCGVPLVALRNRYYIIQLLSDQGGFGRTYLAKDADKLDEFCVVKQLAPKTQETWAIEKSVELFEQEAMRLQQLGQHPQIPKLLAYFRENQYLYLVQEFIEGPTLLQELVQQGTFSALKIRELLIDILGILRFVHQHQVIHRDIKPDNIIRRQTDGKLVLIDFGIAKQLSAKTVARIGTTIGSFGYVPMEQMEDGKVYPASDLYGLGATCFHLLSGIHPWELWKMQGYRWVSDWREYLKQPVNRTLGHILDQLLEKNYAQRYQSVEEVLEDVLRDWNLQAEKTKYRNPWLVVGAFILVGLGGYGIWHIPSPNTAPNPQAALVNSNGGYSIHQPVSIALSPDGKTLVSGGNKEIQIWNLQPWTLNKTLMGHVGWVSSLVISQDSQTLVSGGDDAVIQIRDLNTGELKNELLGQKKEILALAISPDGQMLVSGCRDKIIKIWDLQTGSLNNTLTLHSDQILALAISPDGETLVSGSKDNTINIWDLNTGEPKNTLIGHAGWVSSLAISPDGQMLVSGGGDSKIKVWDLKTGELKTTLVGHTSRVNSLAISPDGETLVSGSQDKSIKIWDLATGQLRDTLIKHKDEVIYVGISPDGQTIVSGSYDATIQVSPMP